MAISKHSSQNRSGRYIDFVDPQPDQFTLEDISQGLARECRFNGQTDEHYSVAQHSVLVSLLMPKEYALAGLVHDGSEAFMRDISSPLKALLPDYRRIEKQVQGAVYEYFGLPRVLPKPMYEALKRADALMTVTERHLLMPMDDREWPGMPSQPLGLFILPMSHAQAAQYFEKRLLSIVEDTPFMPEIDLWAAQHNEWAKRTGQAEALPLEPTKAAEPLRMRNAPAA